MRALEFPRHLFEAEPAPPGSGQFVGRRELEIVRSFDSVTVSVGTFFGRLFPIGCCADAIVGSLGSIRCGARPVTSRPSQDVLASRLLVVIEVVQARKFVPALCATVA